MFLIVFRWRYKLQRQYWYTILHRLLPTEHIYGSDGCKTTVLYQLFQFVKLKYKLMLQKDGLNHYVQVCKVDKYNDKC